MRILAKLFLLTCVPLLAAACSTEFATRACKVDGDCASDRVCLPSQVCVAPQSAPLRIGMSAALSGPNGELGNKMSVGIMLAFDEQNRRGGVRGRPLKLEPLDDGYNPASAETNAEVLLKYKEGSADPVCPSTLASATFGQGTEPVATKTLVRGSDAVLAVIGNVGTPTMVRFAPIALETKTLFFGAFTGAQLLLRDDKAGPCKKYIFNVRASYAQETRATLEYFISRSIKDWKHLLSFDQDDTFGQAGYDGLVNAYKALQSNATLLPLLDPETPETSIQRFRYKRNIQDSVDAQAKAAATHIETNVLSQPGNHVIGILMTDTYGAGAEFIQKIQDWRNATPAIKDRLTFIFSNVSFVGPNALSARLQQLGSPAKYTENVFVTQVVPNYAEEESPVVKAYNDLVPDANARNFTTFEGYITGRIFAAGLVAHKGAFTSDNLISTFESLRDNSLGLGPTSGFSPGDHEYSKKVWGTQIQSNGSFKNIYSWQEGGALELY